MDILKNVITKININTILIKPELPELPKKPEEQETLVKMALHCVLNGPVGVDKPTNFPSFDKKQKYQINAVWEVSNKQWKLACREVALMTKTVWPDEYKDSQMYKLDGDLWPLAEYTAGKTKSYMPSLSAQPQPNPNPVVKPLVTQEDEETIEEIQ